MWQIGPFVSILDEGDMAFLRKKVKSGAAVGKLVLLQVIMLMLSWMSFSVTRTLYYEVAPQSGIRCVVILWGCYNRGKIDKTLFIKMYKDDLLLVSVYVEDIIFGLQVKQKQDGIFISQDKYVVEILKKYGFLEVKNASTPMETQKHLLKDKDGEEVDVHMYRSMISSLMYLTSLRRNIMFAVCACAIYQVNLKVLHLQAMKRIFRYLKGQPKFGLWYPKDFPFDLVAYTDSDYARASLDRESTTGGCQFFRCRLISWQCKKQNVIANSTTEAEYVAASSAKTTPWNEFSSTMASAIICLATNQKFNFSKYIFERMSNHNRIYVTPSHTKKIFGNMKMTRKAKRKDTELPQTSVPTSVVDEAVNEEMDDSLERAATTATSLGAEQDRGNISTTQSKATPNEPSFERTSSGGGPRCQEATGDTVAHTRLSVRVESSVDEGLGEEDESKYRRIVDIDANEDITLVSTDDEQMINVDQDLSGEEVFVAQQEERMLNCLCNSWRKGGSYLLQREQKKRNKPLTQAQQRKIMCTYLENMEGKKLTDLKNKSFDSIMKMFDRAFKRVHIFVVYRTELVEERSNKTEEEVTEGSSKR
nr:hypothetical protein [Tanacetum cinerariifolium]